MYLQVERPLRFRCSPSTYIASKAWDVGLGEVTNTSLDTYNKYATTGTGIGVNLGWDWYGWYYDWNSGGMHENEGSMFMAYVLWGDWRKFERSENQTLWTDLRAASWHSTSPTTPPTGTTCSPTPTTAAPASRRCATPAGTTAPSGTAPTPATAACCRSSSTTTSPATGTPWKQVQVLRPVGELLPLAAVRQGADLYSTYNGNVDDPNFKISDRY